MITPKPLGSAVRLEVSDDPAPGSLVNLVKNPSGELGGWAWLTPVAGTTMRSHQDTNLVWWLDFNTGPGGQATWFTSQPMPVAPARYVAASVQLATTGVGFYRARFEWLNTALAVISSSVQGGYVAVNAGTRQSFGSYQAPAGTAYVRLRVDVYATNTGTVPAANQVMTFNTATVVDAATAAELGTSYTNLVQNPSFETDLTGWTPQGAVSLTRDTTQHAHGVASVRVNNTAATVRRNLLNNPSVETNGTGWAAGAGSDVTRITTQASVGTACIRLAGVAGSSNVVEVTSTQSVPVTPGGTNRLRLRADVRAGSTWPTGATVSVSVRWYDSATHPTGQANLGARVTNPPSGTWVTLDGTAAVPAGTTHARVYVYADTGGRAATVSDVVLVDAVMAEAVITTAPGGGYIDGSLPAAGLVSYAWTGAAHASPSTESTRTGVSNAGPSSAAFTIVGGDYYTGSASVLHGAGASPAPVKLWYDWFDAADVFLSSSAWPYPTSTSATWQRFSSTVTAPVNAAKCRFRVLMNMQPPAADYFVDAVQVEAGQVLHPFVVGTYSDTNIAYVEPVPYTNILGTTHDITITREALNVGTLTANIVDAALDPSHDTLIRPGRDVRLTAYNPVKAAWLPVFTGTATHAAVTYALTEPNAAKRAKVELTAVDNVQALANQLRPEGVASIDELPYILEGCGVPWSVNGSGNQVPTAVVVAENDTASALDQVAVTRDSRLGFAWVDRRGVAQAWDKAKISTTLAGTVLDETVYRDVGIGYNSDDVINEVTIRFLVYDGSTGETNEVIHGPYRNETSIAQWGVSSSEFAVQGGNDDDATMLAYAQTVLNANSVPTVRLNSMELTVDLTPDFAGVAAASWYAWADLYDLVSVTCGRANIAAQKSRITSVSHSLSGPDSKWLVSLGFTADTSVASPTFTPSPGQGAGGLTLSQLLRPVGEVTMWFGAKAQCPAGWLVCDGTTFDPVAYPDLQTLLGSSTLPNFTDRFPIGAGTKALGTAGGNPTVTLGVPHLPAHAHAIARGPAVGTAEAFARGSAVGATMNSETTGTNTPVDILNPWRALWFVIRAR